jgi:hypothetical protein
VRRVEPGWLDVRRLRILGDSTSFILAHCPIPRLQATKGAPYFQLRASCDACAPRA